MGLKPLPHGRGSLSPLAIFARLRRYRGAGQKKRIPMNKVKWLMVAILGTLGSVGLAQREDRPATRPGGGQGQGAMTRMEAVRQAVDSLKPTEEQKKKLQDVLDKFKEEMQSKMQDMR